MLLGAYEMKLRKDGTLCIPKPMRGELGQDVVVIGVGGHLEIWPAEAYRTAQQEMDADTLIRQLAEDAEA